MQLLYFICYMKDDGIGGIEIFSAGASKRESLRLEKSAI